MSGCAAADGVGRVPQRYGTLVFRSSLMRLGVVRQRTDILQRRVTRYLAPGADDVPWPGLSMALGDVGRDRFGRSVAQANEPGRCCPAAVCLLPIAARAKSTGVK